MLKVCTLLCLFPYLYLFINAIYCIYNIIYNLFYQIECVEYHSTVDEVHFDVPRLYSGKKCVPSVPLIVGGKLTRRNEYPEMVLLLLLLF